jgi:hypothetical protein
LTWSGVTGDTPPQSLMPASDQSAERARPQIGRCLHDISGPNSSRAAADGPELLVERRLRCKGHFGARFGAKVLNDDFLDVTVALMKLADGEQRGHALGARLADPDQETRW